MVTKDIRVDEYIEKSGLFAQAILKHIREIVHRACPEVKETIKWQFPHFEYKGLMCSMAAFKKHCVFTFWKGSLLEDPLNILDKSCENSMGQLGKIANLQDLPPDEVLMKYIKEAMRLNDENIKLPKKTKEKNKELLIPDELLNALKNNEKAFEAFNNFSYSKKKEYVDWILDAKQEATKEKRLVKAIEWISEGKGRHWKYE